jgi:hypothetical protein
MPIEAVAKHLFAKGVPAIDLFPLIIMLILVFVLEGSLGGEFRERGR